MNYQFHKAFQLQGKSFNSVEELLEFSIDLGNDIHEFMVEWFSDVAYVTVQTSGSTGVPKSIQLHKKHMINSALATGEFFKIYNGTKALMCMSSNFIAGKMMLVRGLILGWELDVVEPMLNPLENLEKTYDFTAMVPMQLYNSLKDINKVKKVIVGGGVVSNELLAQIKKIETEVFATYGMTETITHIAIKQLNKFKKAEEFSSNYVTLPNVTISKDVRGCLVINAPNISNEVIVTNDLVDIVSDTEFNWLGRYDSIINSGGIKLLPEQIELKLSKVIHQRFFVAGISDAVLGEKLILVIEGKEIPTLEKLIKEILNLAKFEAPKAIYYVERFVETETNKIQRRETIKLIMAYNNIN